MTESTVKQGKGRPSRWGKNDSDKTAIAKDVENFANLTPYYQQKLIGMGFIEIIQTAKGAAFVDQHMK